MFNMVAPADPCGGTPRASCLATRTCPIRVMTARRDDQSERLVFLGYATHIYGNDMRRGPEGSPLHATASFEPPVYVTTRDA